MLQEVQNGTSAKCQLYDKVSHWSFPQLLYSLCVKPKFNLVGEQLEAKGKCLSQCLSHTKGLQEFRNSSNISGLLQDFGLHFMERPENGSHQHQHHHPINTPHVTEAVLLLTSKASCSF